MMRFSTNLGHTRPYTSKDNMVLELIVISLIEMMCSVPVFEFVGAIQSIAYRAVFHQAQPVIGPLVRTGLQKAEALCVIAPSFCQ